MDAYSPGLIGSKFWSQKARDSQLILYAKALFSLDMNLTRSLNSENLTLFDRCLF